MDLLQMLLTTLENHTISMRPKDLQLATEGIAKLARYIGILEWLLAYCVGAWGII